MVNERKVDLYSIDRVVEEIMLSHYPGKILPNQYEVHMEDSDREFSFMGLPVRELISFWRELEIKGIHLDYVLRDSASGRILELDKIFE